MAYTYEDFERAASAAGLLGQFSQWDLDTTRQHPEFGMSLLSLKQDYGKAATDEQKALANAAANELRKSFGSYTGGSDGGGYYSTGPYGAGSIPTRINEALDRVGAYGPFSYSRENEYQAALDEAMERQPFAYDYREDPVWQAYHKQYAREGDRAGADALAQASILTGGSPSTAAITAGQQAANYYAAKAADKIPELYQQAYQRYQQENQDRLNALQTIMTDRERERGEYQDDYNLLLNYLGQLQGRDDELWTRAYQEAQAARTADQQEWERQVQLALQAAAYGDYRGLEALGITPNNENVLANALAAAERTAPVGSGGTRGGTGGGAGGTGGSGGAIDAGMLAQLRTAYPDGTVKNADDWSYLLSVYDEATLNAAGYHYAQEEQKPEATHTPTAEELEDMDFDQASVLNLGYGPISEARLSQLIDRGEVEMYVENGKIRFRRTGRSSGNGRTPALPFVNLLS